MIALYSLPRILTAASDGTPFSDHGDLLGNLVRWAAKENILIAVEGAGLIDVHLYHQPGRLILRLVNLTGAGAWRQSVHELISIGLFRVRVKLIGGVRGKHARLLVSGKEITANTAAGWTRFEIKSILDHEVVAIEEERCPAS